MVDLSFGPGLAADPLLWVCAQGQPATDPVVRSLTQELFVCAPRQPGAYQGARPPGVSVVGPQSANLGARQPGFR